MKKSITTSTLFKLIQTAMTVMLLGFSLSVTASPDDGPSPDIPEGNVSISIVEPARDVGYTVGDILERTVTLRVKKPYKLVETSLPIIGYERRYKGQVSGIELRSIRHKADEQSRDTVYTLHLAYQVFTNNVVAKPAVLPSEPIKFKGPADPTSTDAAKKSGIVQFTIPSWGFRISPIAIYGSVKIEDDMSPLRGPLLLDARQQKHRLKLLIVVLAVSLLGLLYILGKRAWLPLMGRPFAKAYRDIRKLPDTESGLQQAVQRLHQALNATAGSSVFSDNLELFIARKPGFTPIKLDIEHFLGLSRQVFFEPNAAHVAGSQPLNWLKTFCRQCRDCERGLHPEPQGKKA